MLEFKHLEYPIREIRQEIPQEVKRLKGSTEKQLMLVQSDGHESQSATPNSPRIKARKANGSYDPLLRVFYMSALM